MLLAQHRERQINEVCDKEAHRAYELGDVPSGSYTQDTSVASLVIGDKVMTNKIKETVIQTAHTNPIKDYLIDKYGWSGQVMQTID